MREVPENVLRAVNKLIDLVSRRFKVTQAYLFGSYAKGTWLKSSDIDLIIVSPDFRNIEFLKRLDIINEIQWRARIRPFIEVIPLTPEELERKRKESTLIRDASRYWIRVK